MALIDALTMKNIAVTINKRETYDQVHMSPLEPIKWRTWIGDNYRDGVCELAMKVIEQPECTCSSSPELDLALGECPIHD